MRFNLGQLVHCRDAPKEGWVAARYSVGNYNYYWVTEAKNKNNLNLTLHIIREFNIIYPNIEFHPHITLWSRQMSFKIYPEYRLKPWQSARASLV